MFNKLVREFRISKLQTIKRIAGFGLAAIVLHAVGLNLFWPAALFYCVLYLLLFIYKVARDRNLKTANEYVRPTLPTPTQTSSGSNGLKVPTPMNRDQ